MKLCVWASGSTGNCAMVSGTGARVLLDAGISMRRIKTALAEEGLTPADLAGVLVTHEHSDHVSGLKMLSRSWKLPIYAPRTVAWHLSRSIPETEEHLRIITPGECFTLGEMKIEAFRTPHDTDESVGYVFEENGQRFGSCTDTGCITNEMLSALLGCRMALIEANHDVDMLRYGPYPAELKRRVLSDRGHLSNENCGRLAAELAAGGTGKIVLGHLSRTNNIPGLARRTVRAILDEAGFPHTELLVAPELGCLQAEV